MRVKKLVFYQSIQDIQKKKLILKKEQLESYLTDYSSYLKKAYFKQMDQSLNRLCLYIPAEMIGLTLFPVYFGYHEFVFMSLSTSLVTSFITIQLSSSRLEKKNIYTQSEKHRQKLIKQLKKTNKKLQKKYHK